MAHAIIASANNAQDDWTSGTKLPTRGGMTGSSTMPQHGPINDPVATVVIPRGQHL